jgi:hypothetical protein
MNDTENRHTNRFAPFGSAKGIRRAEQPINASVV